MKGYRQGFLSLSNLQIVQSHRQDKEIHNVLVSIIFTRLIPYMSIVTLTFKIDRVYPLTMANMSAKFDQVAHNGLVSIVFTSLFHICPLGP